MTKLASDRKDINGKWLRSFSDNKVEFRTVSGSRWYGMISRCKFGGVHPQTSYAGCTVSDSFKDFQQFTDWHVSQIGYCLEGYDIDKDFLGDGKIYSEDVCVLIPNALNKFLTYENNTNSGLPIGVSVDNRYMDRYRTHIRIGSSRYHLGTFRNAEDAGNAWVVAKKKEAARWYQRLLNKEFVVDARVIEALYRWEP